MSLFPRKEELQRLLAGFTPSEEKPEKERMAVTGQSCPSTKGLMQGKCVCV